MDRAGEDAEKVRPTRPQRAKGQGVHGWYVEALNEARTPLAGLCNILSLTRQVPADYCPSCPAFSLKHWHSIGTPCTKPDGPLSGAGWP